MANMWTKKHKELKTQSHLKTTANGVKFTAADLAAVKIIQGWFQKSRVSHSIKPETKKVVHGEFVSFKEMQKKLAMARNGIVEKIPNDDSSQKSKKPQIIKSVAQIE